MANHSLDDSAPIDWEAFYANFRKPGFIRGYEILAKLGSGAFGLVYKARKESIGKHYAIKFLKVDDEAVRDAVRKELESVRYFAQVDHPNLVAIEDRGEIDGIPYIIMAYAGDSTLRRRIDAGDLLRDEALRLFVQVARGVAALHERALVHFDLKPANIYLKGDVARVGDYGLSKLVTESCNSLSFGRGTPYYMAPEMMKRRGDHSSDIYSLGVLLFEMLVGKPPFIGDSEWEILKQHESSAPTIPSHINAVEAEVIRTCLAKEPRDRFATVDALLEMLTRPHAAVPPMGARSSRTTPANINVTRLPNPSPAKAVPHTRPADPLRSRSRFPTFSGGRAFMLALCLCVGTGVLISLVTYAGLSSKRTRSRVIRMVDRVAPIAQELAMEMPEVFSSSSPRAFAFDHQQIVTSGHKADYAARLELTRDLPRFGTATFGTNSTARNLQELLDRFDVVDRKTLARIKREVDRQGIIVAPLLVDRLCDLEYTCVDHIRVGQKLDELLCRVLGQPSSYRGIDRRADSVSLQIAAHNSQIAGNWHQQIMHIVEQKQAKRSGRRNGRR